MALLVSLLTFVAILVPGYFIVAHLARRQAHPAKTRDQNKNQQQTKHDSMRLPYRYADRHLFVHGEGVWTGVRLAGVVDDHLSDEELDDLVSAATNAVKELASGDETIYAQVRLTHRPITVDDWADDLNRRAWNPTENYKVANRRIAERVFASGSTRPEIVMFVRVGLLSEFRRHSHLQAQTSVAVSGVADDEFTPDEIAQWEHVAAEVHDKLAPLKVTPLTRDDVLWCIRKPLYGHLTPPPPDIVESRPWGAGQFELLVDLRGNNHRTHLELEQVDENGRVDTSYTAFLVPESWPKRDEFKRNAAWLRSLARIGYPVEAAYGVELIGPQKFAAEVKKIQDDLLDEQKNHAQHNAGGDHLLDTQLAEAEQLSKATIDEGPPGMDTQLVVQVSAPSREDLEDILPGIVRDVRHRTRGIMLVRPKRRPWRLLNAMLPGHTEKMPMAPHHRLQEAEVFGVGLPNVGFEVGDRPVPNPNSPGEELGWRGDYIGVRNDVPVHFGLHVAIARNAGGGTTLTGASGEGKTSLALLKFWQTSESGCLTVALDPKIDFAAFCYYMSFGSQVNDPDFDAHAAEGCLGAEGCPFQPINREFWDDTTIVDIARSREGAFDPFQFSKDVSEGRLLAETMLQGFLGRKMFDDIEFEVVEALNGVVADYRERVEAEKNAGKSVAEAEQSAARPTLWEVVDRVSTAHRDAKEHGEDAETVHKLKKAAQALTNLRTLPKARLAFAETPAPIDALKRRRTVFTLRGLRMPPKEKPVESWDPQERLVATMVLAVTNWVFQMFDAPKETHPISGLPGQTRPKVLFQDEAYVLNAFDAGVQTLRIGRSQGRSLNFATVLIDQQVARLAQVETDSEDDEGAGNQTATVISFRQKTSAEGEAVATLMGRKGQQQIPKALKAVTRGGLMENSVALMSDLDDRIGALHVDLVFGEMLAATDTNPDTRPLRQAVDPPASVADWTFMEQMPPLRVRPPSPAVVEPDDEVGEPEAFEEEPA